MSKITLTLSLFLLFTVYGHAQETGAIKGVLIDYKTQKPLENTAIRLVGTQFSEQSNFDGLFLINNIPFGEYLLKISQTGYELQRYPISINDTKTIDLGTIYLYVDDMVFNDANQIVWSEDNPYENNQSYYSNSKDVFLKRVGFDFSPTFFSFRGYDAGKSKIVLNGIDMSNLYNNRPIWNTFSGLNDITRNRESTISLAYSNQNFGGLSGTTFINAAPSEM